MKFNWKKIAPYLVALVVFMGLAMIYCSPAMDGKVLHAGDVDHWKGAAHEVQVYKQQTGETSWWTNSMFGGMPTYQITGTLPSGEVRNVMADVTHFGIEGQNPIGMLFAYFVGFFLLLICFGVNPWLSIAGALGIGMSSYFFIIIPAGHFTKVCALGYLAPMIGGFYAIMRKNYWLGIPMVLFYGFLGTTLHPQMTYYMGLLVGVFICAELYIHGYARQWKQLGISVGVLVICALLVLGTKWSWMDMNRSYLKETMRGGHSELTQTQEEKDAEQNSKGLDFKYATDWSYGIDETMTFLIPNFEGGSSYYNIGPDTPLGEELQEMGIDKRGAKQLCKYAPTYRGDKKFTSGAVYIGAVICFLFILGLIIVPGAYKWALLFATIMSILLAWGRHLPFLSHFFFDYFPMYNKFRAVESILVVAEVTMPLLGFLGLQRIIEGDVEWKKLRRSLFIAGGFTAGICLVVVLSASSIDMTSSYDNIQYFTEQGKLVRTGSVNSWLSHFAPINQLSETDYEYLYDQFYPIILEQRQAMLTADAWRSLIFIIMGFSLVYGYAWMRNNRGEKQGYNIALCVGLLVLIIADMMPVNKRFFNDDNFVKAKDNDQNFQEQAWETKILEDTCLDFRVFNIASGDYTTDARTSYRLKSIGGYSAVKLRRYQDLMDRHINRNNVNVLNMLNTRYFIHPQYGVMQNPEAMGNAWFVEEVQFVPTPDDESNALYNLDLHKTAVADEKFRDVLTCEAKSNADDSTAINNSIVMTEYLPKRLTYSASTTHDRVAVFSEIYYPEGWHLYVDGKETPIGRVNYVLRAAVIPAGEHTIVMEFVPKALQKDKVSYVVVILLLLISIGCITWPLWKKYVPQKVKSLLAKTE